MADIQYIARRPPETEGPDFDALRAQGLQWLQALCGTTWTDHNVHDPGITILEALCYALTDLMYRTDFALADYLTDPNGALDFEQHALYRPQHILPSQPITLSDYRKLVFDALPELDNVWLRMEPTAPIQGLYHIQVLVGDTVGDDPVAQDALLARVRQVYAAHRNLCEDLEQVSLVASHAYRLYGTVQIDSQYAPDEILAALYWQCSTMLTPRLRFTAFAEVIRQGKSLEELYTGPLTQHVYLDDEACEPTPSVVTIADLIAPLRRLEGIRDIVSLWFEDETGARVEEIQAEGMIPRLHFPTQEQDIRVQLYSNGRVCPVHLKTVQEAWRRLHSRYQAMRHVPQDFNAIAALPTGVARPFALYTSLQYDFPAIYGINAYGIPATAEPLRQAQARQLKAYLLLFEQVLANFLENVQHLGQLFSLDEALQQTYFAQSLRHPEVPNVDELYQGDLAQLQARLTAIAGRYDPANDRRHRLLDYLLALYGETFTQNALRRFPYYQTTATELEQFMIQNKIRFLRELVELSQRRAGAFRVHEVAWDTSNVSTLQKKVGILLGLPFVQTRSLSDVLQQYGLAIVDEAPWEPADMVELAFATRGDLEEHTWTPEPVLAAVTCTPEEARRLRDEVPLFSNGVLSVAILRNGLESARYRLRSTGEEVGVQLLFRPATEPLRWLVLGAYATEDEAREAAWRVRRFVLDLNVASEGLHVVEHVLLRPLVSEATPPETLADFYPSDMPLPPADFHAFRLSVLFPAWSARFQDSEFRKLAEETVRLNCPAHLEATCYWLDFPAMRLFEDLYRTWLEARRGSDAVARNAAAQQVMRFLLAPSA